MRSREKNISSSQREKKKKEKKKKQVMMDDEEVVPLFYCILHVVRVIMPLHDI